MIEVREISTEETFPLRLQVLWPHLSSLDECLLPTDNLPGTFHVGVLQNGTVMSTGTFLVQKNPKLSYEKQYRLRAMATAPEAKGKGFGKQLILYAVNKLKQRKAEVLWCDARKNALGFYEKLNFQTIGDFYTVPKIGLHKLMFYIIKN